MFKIGDKVVKNPLTWEESEFDDWGRGIGIGIVVESPFELDDDTVDVKWELGRCFENINNLSLYNQIEDDNKN